MGEIVMGWCEKGDRKPSRAFTKAIIDLRKYKYKESQQAFSNRLGLSLRAIANYESGGKRPTLSVLIDLARLSMGKDLASIHACIVAEIRTELKLLSSETLGI